MKKKLQNVINKFLNDFFNWNPPVIFIFAIIFVFSIFISLIHFKLDNDFWFLINTGKYIINNGFPITEPFTIHSELSFIIQQWLTDVIFYYVYNKFDINGMLFLVTAVNIIVTFLIYKICMLVSEKRVKYSILLTILVSILLNMTFMTTRPQIFDILFLLFEIYLLELYIKQNNKLYLIGLPVISLLMINLHSSIWLMLFVFLLPYFFESIIKIKYFDKEKYKIKYLIVTAIIMFLTGFINPYGIEAITYLFNSYGVDTINNLVNEMKPTTIDTFIGIIAFIYTLFILFSYYYNKDNKIKLRYLLLFLGCCYLGLSHNRGVMFLFIGGIPSYVYNFKNMITQKEKTRYLYSNKIVNISFIISVLIFVVMYGWILFNINIKEKNINHLHDVVDYLDKIADKKASVYTNYNDGGYLEYRGYNCYLDPRADVFLKSNNKKEDILNEFQNLQSGQLNYKEFLMKYKFDYLIVNDYDLLYNYIKIEDGYNYVYERAITNQYTDEIRKYRIYQRI